MPEDDQSIFIRNAIAPPAARNGGSCLYTGDPSQPGLFGGVLDVAVRTNYELTVLVGSQLIARADPAQPRAESNRVKLNGAVVRVTDANGIQLGEFTSLGSGFVNPLTGADPGFGPFNFTAIDAPTLARIVGGANLSDQANPFSKLVIVNAKVFGATLGGVDLESGEFQFRVQVCNKCLLSFATGDDPLTEGIDCNLSTTTAGAAAGAAPVLPCNPGQDEATPCEVCRVRNEACRSL